MYKMLIVDDEALARYAFRTLLSKNFTDIEVVGEAESGSQSVEMARALKPDVIAMDIKMPGINGIEASEQILSEQPDTGILILTAYDNFHYVQKALDLGVKGYLLKPFKKEEVVDKLRKILEGIESEKKRDSSRELVDSKIKAVKPFIERELIATLMGGSPDIDEFRSYMNFLQETIEAGYFMLISFGQHVAASINDSVRNRIYRHKVTDVLEKHLPLLKKCILGYPVGNTAVAFFPCEAGFLQKAVIQESLVIAQEIKRRIKVIAGIDTAVGIGNPYGELRDLKKSYTEAYSAVGEAAAGNEVVHYSTCGSLLMQEAPVYPIKLENKLLEELRLRNTEQAGELVKELLEELARCADIGILREYAFQFIAILKRTLLQMGTGTDVLTARGILADAGKLEEAEDLLLWCKNSAFSMLELIEPLKQSRDAGKIKKVHEYVRRNLFKDITLEMAAEEAGLSPQYLSRIFKEETGMNFIEYITGKRIQRACELLKNGTGSIREVSSAVGYSDVNYFCRIFKKVTGVTPGQYKDGSFL